MVLKALHRGRYHYSHFTDGGIEAQSQEEREGDVTCPRSLSRPVAEREIEPRSLESWSNAPSTRPCQRATRLVEEVALALKAEGGEG